MYKAGTNLFIIVYFYHAKGKSMEISRCKTGTNLLIFFYFYHATGQSMEISMYKAGTNLLIIFYFTMPLANPWKFPCTRLEQTYS